MDSLKDYLQNNINRLNNKLTSYLDIESSDLVREELESYEEQLKELNDLIEENNILNKGIDELLIKYEEELSKYSKLLKEANNNDILDAIAYQAICDFYIKVIQDLKKLKGE